MVAKRVDLGLALLQFSDPLNFGSVKLHDGTINLANLTPDDALPFQAGRLQLNNMRIESPNAALPLSARQVNGGIMPWKPTSQNMLGSDTQFQMSVGDMTLNKVSGANVLIQGSVAKGRINGRFELNDPIVNLDLLPQGITLTQFSSRRANGMIRADGRWSRSNKQLTLNNLAIAGLEYTLSENWRDSWLAALPTWLDSVAVKRFTSNNRNLIIDINPAFPFQMTSLDGSGENLLLARQHQWGIWSGKLSLNAAAATFNRIDLRHPSLSLNADDRQIAITELRAFSGGGLLEGSASVGQQPDRPLALTLKGHAVPASVLQNWDWPTAIGQRPQQFPAPARRLLA